jgi:UDP:flavonoid glycosyltransferase YjiC (YdhE family)
VAEILISSCPPIGHVGPLLTVARGLVDRGDRVTFPTSQRHASKILDAGAFPEPLPAEAGWPELHGERPVVHVTQGTIDNADLGRPVEPTIAALAEEDVTVVVTTGGRNVSRIRIPFPPTPSSLTSFRTTYCFRMSTPWSRTEATAPCSVR